MKDCCSINNRWITSLLAVGLCLFVPGGIFASDRQVLQATLEIDPENQKVYDELADELTRIAKEMKTNGVGPTTEGEVRRVLDVVAPLHAEMSRRLIAAFRSSLLPGGGPARGTGRPDSIVGPHRAAFIVLQCARTLLADVYSRQVKVEAAYWLVQPAHFRRTLPLAQELWEKSGKALEEEGAETPEVRDLRRKIASVDKEMERRREDEKKDPTESDRLFRQRYNLMCDLSELYLKAGKREAAYYLVRDVEANDLVLLAARKKDLISRIGSL